MGILGGDPTTGAIDPPRVRTIARSSAGPRAETRWTKGHMPGEVGIWIFVFGDMLVFGMFFMVFMAERSSNIEEFGAGRETLHTAFGAVNTLLLLTGSILVVLAMRAIKEDLAERARPLILGAMGTGLLFIVNKGWEYGDKLSNDLDPGTNDFYTLFFAFTGIHLLHLFIGMAALTYLYAQAKKPTRDAHTVSNMESCASFWHLVDLLWIVLFPLFYLVA